ncbi:MAG: hypothetical protein K6G01_06700 [Eubacterium sp.]|nr:hypothetical protein [Eubacterium sp.]
MDNQNYSPIPEPEDEKREKKRQRRKKRRKVWLVILGVIVLLFVVRIIAINISEMSQYRTKLNWPQTKLSAMLPTPDSKYGEVKSSNEEYLDVDVYKYKLEDYQEYVTKCEELGFTVNYDYSDRSYDAENAEGYRLDLYYYSDDHTLAISLRVPQEEEENDTQEEAKTEEKTEEKEEEQEEEQAKTTSADTSDNASEESEKIKEKSSDKVSKKFKKTMKKYEKFFDEYIEFMEKYKNGELSTTEMLTDYSEYLTKYSEAMDALSELEDEEMTDAEYKYYTKVMTRINEKLAEASIY